MRCGMWMLLLTVSAGLTGGCGGGGPAAATIGGAVTVDGKPLDMGVISCVAEANGATATAEMKNGRYEIRTVAGLNRIRISAPVVVGTRKESSASNAPLVEITEESLPDKYHSKSDLTFDAKPGGNTKDWELEGKVRKR